MKETLVETISETLSQMDYVYLDVEVLESGNVLFSKNIKKYFLLPKILLNSQDFLGKHRLLFKISEQNKNKYRIIFDENLVYKIFEDKISDDECYKILPDICKNVIYLSDDRVIKNMNTFSTAIKVKGFYRESLSLRTTGDKDEGIFVLNDGKYKFKSLKETVP